MTLTSLSTCSHTGNGFLDDRTTKHVDPPPSVQTPHPLSQNIDIASEETRLSPAVPIAVETGSDYGDFGTDEEDEINDILSKIPYPSDVAVEPLVVTDIEDYESPAGVRLPKVLGLERTAASWIPQVQPQRQGRAVLDSDSISSKLENPVGRESRRTSERERSAFAESESKSSVPDKRSPLDRFRRPPRKALSVTDLVSPAWCELQYFYTLTKHGRKRRTPAMKQGTKIHKVLEEEIHTTVPVDVTTKEDGWGLRIWNIIQGLRTLRDTGTTRELEVWGVIGGELVNGIIDELGYLCPDPRLESESEGRYKAAAEDKNALPEYQASIIDYLISPAGGEGRPISEMGKDHEMEEARRMPPPPAPTKKRKPADDRRIYITDIKTRRTHTLPDAASIRPTILQLHLYHHMISNLSLGNFPLSILAERYELDTQAVFSDSFIAQVGSLNQDFFDAVSEPDPGIDNTGSTIEPADATSATLFSQIASSQDSTELLLQHNHLASLWSLMQSHFRDTFLLLSPSPSPLVPATRLSPLLTATYLSSSTSEFLGRKSVLYSPASLHAYLDDGMKWWRGEREARGVELCEAWKCRSCDFRDDCAWIHERDRMAREEVNKRRSLRSGKEEEDGGEGWRGGEDIAVVAGGGGGGGRRSGRSEV